MLSNAGMIWAAVSKLFTPPPSWFHRTVSSTAAMRMHTRTVVFENVQMIFQV